MWLSGKNHHNFEAKMKFGRWFRYHRRAYPTPNVLTPAKFDLHFRLSRGCSSSELPDASWEVGTFIRKVYRGNVESKKGISVIYLKSFNKDYHAKSDISEYGPNKKHDWVIVQYGMIGS